MQMPVWNGFSRIGTRAVLWILASSMGAVALGQDTAPDVPDDGSDTPDEVVAPERVARLSFLTGSVSLQGVGETAWAPATLNRPLTPGDFLRTENDGRAEVQVGSATLRMGAGSSFAFTTLDDDALRMRLSVGVLNLRVRTLDENEAIEVETPQATASILRPGSYRLEVNPDGTATVAKVSSGMLEARGQSGQSVVVRPQQVATLTGTAQLSVATATLGAPDSFDQWALERDRHDEYALSTEASRNVPADTVGYEDLDNYGTWTSEPEYGYVWTPSNVAADWTPYRYGQYRYVSGWGWAWIDNTPWGFAPYHYGSWVTINNRWCWVPGPRHGRPVGRPNVVGRPSQSPGRGWHVPRPPRGYTARSGVPTSEITRIGTRPGLVSADDRERREAWRDRREGSTNGGRFRTVPDPIVVPPTTVPPSEDRRQRTPRYDVPRNPRDDARVYTPPPPATTPRVEQPRRDGGRFTVSPPPQQRPATPPPQQQQARPAPPPPQQSQQSGRNGGADRAPNGRPRTLER